MQDWKLDSLASVLYFTNYVFEGKLKGRELYKKVTNSFPWVKKGTIREYLKDLEALKPI